MSTKRDFTIVENHRPHRPVEAPCSESDLARFADDGFLVLPGAIEPSQCDGLVDATERICREEGHEAGGGGIFLRHLMDKDRAFLELLRQEPFLSIARLMLGPMVRVLPTTARIAVPGKEAQEVSWHIHQRLVPEPRPPFFSQPVVLDTLIYLDDVDEETGPLLVVPGSHRITQHGIPHHHADLPNQVKRMPRRGDAIMMHGNVWHRALLTTPRGRRRRLLIHPFGPAWVDLPTYGERPRDGLLDSLAVDADPELRELLGMTDQLY